MMGRPTWRMMTLVFSVLVFGLVVGYRLADPSIYESDGPSKRDSNLVSYESRVTYTTRARIGTELNSTTTSTGGQQCRRLWKRGTSEWFDEKYDDSLLPVWMKENKKLSEETEKWWISLQGNKDKDYIAALDDAFKVIPDPRRFLTHNVSQCLRCAVVGNSGNLKDSGYGNIIDSHDVVVRINQAKVKGFEKDVGKKETHRLMYPESFMDIPPETNFVLLNFKVIDVKWVKSAITTGEIKKTYTKVKSKIRVTPSKILFYNPALMFHIHREWIGRKGRYPSSGTLAIFFALQFCDEVSVFGMGANKKGFWDHYWQAGDGSSNSAFLKTHVHDSVHEFEVIKKLAEEKIITLYQGVR